MSEQKYRMDCNSLVLPENLVIRNGENITSGKLTLTLDCEWPGNVPTYCQRIWYIVDGPKDLSIVTEYRGPDGETVVRRDAAILAKINTYSVLGETGFLNQ